jgi:hypothetical protein
MQWTKEGWTETAMQMMTLNYPRVSPHEFEHVKRKVTFNVKMTSET